MQNIHFPTLRKIETLGGNKKRFNHTVYLVRKGNLSTLLTKYQLIAVTYLRSSNEGQLSVEFN